MKWTRRRNARNMLMPQKDHERAGASTAATDPAEDVPPLRYPRNTERPGYRAEPLSCSSRRISWLYLASRSERDSDPVLICPQLVATAKSAIVVSSVSPERCEKTVPQPARCAISTASSGSHRVPIWLTLT